MRCRRPTVFVHTYKDRDRGSIDFKVEGHEAPADDWQALRPFKHAITNQSAVLGQYKCASISLRSAPTHAQHQCFP